MRLIIPVMLVLLMSCGPSPHSGGSQAGDTTMTSQTDAMASTILSDTEKMKAGSYYSTAKQNPGGMAISIRAIYHPGKCRMVHYFLMLIPAVNVQAWIW